MAEIVFISGNDCSILKGRVSPQGLRKNFLTTGIKLFLKYIYRHDAE